ncbi:hypothetical protein JM48_0568 [Lactiplantibacillus plantarum]|nr:hypothetical protein JM48_0568 [Lactiplantibacillus plantarum]
MKLNGYKKGFPELFREAFLTYLNHESLIVTHKYSVKINVETLG